MSDQNIAECSDKSCMDLNETYANTIGSGSFFYKRCNSTGSIHRGTSSANTTDDSDSDMGFHVSMKDRRREAHTAAEQKRRDAIKQGYDRLQELVPSCQNVESQQNLKLSKANILQKTVDYICYMQDCKKRQEEAVTALRKEEVGMTIMKLNYDQIVSAHRNQPGNPSMQLSEDVKFEVFRVLVDSLFQTFDPCVTTNSFAEISGSVIQWVEEHCKPQILREIMSRILEQVRNQTSNNSTNSFPETHATIYSLSANHNSLMTNYNSLPNSRNNVSTNHNSLSSNHSSLSNNNNSLSTSLHNLPTNADSYSTSLSSLPTSLNL